MSTFITKFKALLNSKCRVVARIVKYGIITAVCLFFACVLTVNIVSHDPTVNYKTIGPQNCADLLIGCVYLAAISAFSIGVSIWQLSSKRYLLPDDEKGAITVKNSYFVIITAFLICLFCDSFIDRDMIYWSFLPYLLWNAIYNGMLFRSSRIDKIPKRIKNLLSLFFASLTVILIIALYGKINSRAYSYLGDLERYQKKVLGLTVFTIVGTLMMSASLLLSVIFANSLINFDKKEEITAVEAE